MTRNTTVNIAIRRIVIQIHIILKVSGSGGNDSKDNLIELCSECHRKVHDGIIEKQELLKIIYRRK